MSRFCSALCPVWIVLVALVAFPKHIYGQQNLIWYDVDHSAIDGRPAGGGGWFAINPNQPDTVPNDGQQYRTTTPLLGLYTSSDTSTILQHAYWFDALRATGVIVDWTNNSPAIAAYTNALINNTADIFSVYSTLGGSSFPAPKVVIAARLASLSASDEATAEGYLDQAYTLYTQYPSLTVTLPGDSRPLLLLFVDFTSGAWQNGPQFTDSRFNIRYMNGYLDSRPNLVQPLTGTVDKIANDYPYWDFVDNTVGNGNFGDYRGVISQKMESGDEVTEFASAWVGLQVSGLQWDGVFGLTTLVNGASGKCLDDTGASTSNGTQMQQWTCNGQLQQSWSIIPNGTSSILLNELSGLVLDDTGASASNGTIMQQWAGGGYAQQNWALSPNGTNTYKLINNLSGKCLDDTGASTANGSLQQQWTCNGLAQQNWTINPSPVFQRELAPIASYSPQVLEIARFNYAVGWYAQPQEGVSLNSATMIEPTQDYGFQLFDVVNKNLASFRVYSQSAPTYSGQGIGLNGINDALWTNWPTQYQLSAGSPDPTVSWQTVLYGGIPVPSSGHYIRTRNSFGISAWQSF